MENQSRDFRRALANMSKKSEDINNKSKKEEQEELLEKIGKNARKAIEIMKNGEGRQ
jgi:hypothetical protein